MQIRRKRLILKDFRELQSREAAEADVRTVGDLSAVTDMLQHQRNNELKHLTPFDTNWKKGSGATPLTQDLRK